jgi:hypothetical protein
MTLWPRSCDLVGYYGWARTNMESAGALKSWRVLVCGAAMLSHVLRPRFNHKILDVPAGLGDIREQALVWRPANNFTILLGLSAAFALKN